MQNLILEKFDTSLPALVLGILVRNFSFFTLLLLFYFTSGPHRKEIFSNREFLFHRNSCLNVDTFFSKS